MMSSIRVALVVMVAVVTLTVVMAGGNSSAAGNQAAWQLYERAAPITPFLAAATPIPSPGAGAGYEIISFDAQPLSTGLATYVYGGADLPPGLGGPAAPLVTCTADFAATTMNLHVGGAFPYAGCVFFIGAQNIGDGPITVELGSLADPAAVSCSAPGCHASDIELVAGGPDEAAIQELCRFEGAVAPAEGPLQFTLDIGATVICPIFVVVLQPSAEGALYTIVIDPPPPGAGSSGPQPGVVSTPIAPATGSGLVTFGAGSSNLWIVYVVIAAAVLTLVIAWPRRT